MKKVLLDTDIGPDCDDVGALALLNRFADAGLCEILGVGHCTSNPFGAPAIDVICRAYGRAEIPIGTYAGDGFLCDENCQKYNRDLATRYEHRFSHAAPEDAVKMYRRLLAAAEDGSVDFIAIGPLCNLSALLDSAPDEVSPRSGRELVERKVKRLTAMAGIFETPDGECLARAARLCGCPAPDFAEYNVFCDIAAAQNVATHWPGEKVFLGFEAGLILTGARLSELAPAHSVRRAYELYTENGLRYSWDLLTVDFAVCGTGTHFALSERGKVSFTAGGQTRFRPGAGDDRFICYACDGAKIAADIDAWLVE